MPHDLPALNAMSEAAFTDALGAIFEHSPWVARAVAGGRPYASIGALHGAMTAAVAAAPSDQVTALLLAHPDLATGESLTAASSAEQKTLGFTTLARDEAADFDAAKAAYRARFGFPFIIAVRGQRDRASIRAALAARMGHSPGEERAAALAEIGQIARFRLEDAIIP